MLPKTLEYAIKTKDKIKNQWATLDEIRDLTLDKTERLKAEKRPLERDILKETKKIKVNIKTKAENITITNQWL